MSDSDWEILVIRGEPLRDEVFDEEKYNFKVYGMNFRTRQSHGPETIHACSEAQAIELFMLGLPHASDTVRYP
jgi:hypothetical protein